MIHDVLVIGAGLAGLKVAGDLHAAGRSVLLLDKGRGVGGRAATRRWDGVPVDHGAQFFTARSDDFRAQVEEWEKRGVCFPWTNAFSQWDHDGRGVRAPDPAEAKHPRYACRAGMSALGKDLVRRLPEAAILLKSRAAKLQRADDCWQVELETPTEGEAIAGRSLILAMPTPQTVVLLKDSGLFDDLDEPVRSSLERVEYAPTLAVMLRGEAARPDWQGIQLRDKTLYWISDDSSKREGGHPGATPTAPRVFMLHATPEFSSQWQDADLEEATRLMVARAGELVGDWIVRLPERQIHRWRYANVPQGVLDVAYLRNKAGDIYVCGDAFLGAKVEGAYCSGLEAAKEYLRAHSR